MPVCVFQCVLVSFYVNFAYGSVPTNSSQHTTHGELNIVFIYLLTDYCVCIVFSFILKLLCRFPSPDSMLLNKVPIFYSDSYIDNSRPELALHCWQLVGKTNVYGTNDLLCVHLTLNVNHTFTFKFQ